MVDESGAVTLRIGSLEQVAEILRDLKGGAERPFPDRIEFTGELESVFIRITGEKYHSTVPGVFARGVWGLQEEVYRAVAYALYGTEDLRKLSKEDYERFNLVFEVDEGSSALQAAVTAFMASLATGLSDMDDTSKLIAVLGVAVILTTGFVVSRIGRAHYEAQTKKLEMDGSIKVEEVRSKAEVERMAETTKQIQAMVGENPVVSQFERATMTGARQIVKSVPDATSATVGITSFDREAIKEIGARAARDIPVSDTLKEEFIIITYKRPENADLARLTLSSRSGEIAAAMDVSDLGPFSSSQLDKFWDALQRQEKILLHVDVKIAGDVIKQAWVSDIPEVEEDFAL